MNNTFIRCVPMYSFADPTPDVYYQHPKFLENEAFDNLNSDARLLYVYMRDRLTLSIENKFYDKEHRLFIYFTAQEAAKRLKVSKNTAAKAFSALEKSGLIYRKRIGFGNAYRIFVQDVI